PLANPFFGLFEQRLLVGVTIEAVLVGMGSAPLADGVDDATAGTTDAGLSHLLVRPLGSIRIAQHLVRLAELAQQERTLRRIQRAQLLDVLTEASPEGLLGGEGRGLEFQRPQRVVEAERLVVGPRVEQFPQMGGAVADQLRIVDSPDVGVTANG